MTECARLLISQSHVTKSPDPAVIPVKTEGGTRLDFYLLCV